MHSAEVSTRMTRSSENAVVAIDPKKTSNNGQVSFW